MSQEAAEQDLMGGTGIRSGRVETEEEWDLLGRWAGRDRRKRRGRWQGGAQEKEALGKQDKDEVKGNICFL